MGFNVEFIIVCMYMYNVLYSPCECLLYNKLYVSRSYCSPVNECVMSFLDLSILIAIPTFGVTEVIPVYRLSGILKGKLISTFTVNDLNKLSLSLMCAG